MNCCEIFLIWETLCLMTAPTRPKLRRLNGTTWIWLHLKRVHKQEEKTAIKEPPFFRFLPIASFISKSLESKIQHLFAWVISTTFVPYKLDFLTSVANIWNCCWWYLSIFSWLTNFLYWLAMNCGGLLNKFSCSKKMMTDLWEYLVSPEMMYILSNGLLKLSLKLMLLCYSILLVFRR